MIRKCRICQGELDIILDLGKQPLANNLSSKKNDIKKIYDLKLCSCKRCGTCQHNVNISLDDLYSEYFYSSSISKDLNDNALNFAEEIKYKYRYKNIKILEIGSNDGYLLKNLNEQFFCLGVDPSSNMTKISKSLGIKTIKDFFNSKTSKYIRKKYGTFDLIIANNVMAHNPNMISILKEMKNLLNQNGEICIELQDSSSLLKNALFDMIYHEHFFYFDKNTFSNLLLKCNLNAYKIKKLNLHGGSIRFYINKDLNKTTYLKNSLKKIEFHKKVSKVKNNVISFLNKNKNKKIICFGAAAKTTVFLNFFNINNLNIKYVIDDTKIKQNKFIPNTGIKIVNQNFLKKYKPEFIILTAWNYKDFLLKKLEYTRNWNCKIVTFFPNYKIYE